MRILGLNSAEEVQSFQPSKSFIYRLADSGPFYTKIPKFKMPCWDILTDHLWITSHGGEAGSRAIKVTNNDQTSGTATTESTEAENSSVI